MIPRSTLRTVCFFFWGKAADLARRAMPSRGDQVDDPDVLWPAQSEDLEAAATGGRVAERQRSTGTTLFFARGTLTTSPWAREAWSL